MDPRRGYAAGFVEESLGFARGDVHPEAVPSELVEMLADAMRGSGQSQSPKPGVERSILSFGLETAAELESRRGSMLFRERWPGGARYAACLTHDVDNVSRTLSHLLSTRRRFGLSDLVLAILSLRNLYDNTRLLAAMEGSRGFRSSFYLLTKNYDLRQRSGELKSLLDAGWDVGLHGDFGTHDSHERMATALAAFREATGIIPVGVREHYLRFDYGSTWDVMERAGFVYDTTVGNTDRLGFRTGLCTPFHPPDGEWRKRRILELPLVLMDVTLWGYMNRTEEEGLGDFEGLRDEVAAVNGLFTVLWHPEGVRMKGGRIYPLLLDRLARDGCFVGSGREVSDWWTRRSGPLLFEEGVYTMEEAPPGLVLRFKSKEGMPPAVEGGTVEAEAGGAVIRATGGRLRVKVT